LPHQHGTDWPRLCREGAACSKKYESSFDFIEAGPAGAAGKLGMKRTSLQYEMREPGITCQG
jgi:hypothetical protein